MKKTVFITIGEAPRKDLAETYDRYFKNDTHVRQVGLLDGLTSEEALKKYGVQGEESHSLTSVFANGRSIVMSHAKVERGIQECIDRLDDAEEICILCTGSFKELHAGKSILTEAEAITVSETKKKYQGKKIGVLVPLPQQIEDAMEKWEITSPALFRAASPYHFDEAVFRQAAEELAAENAAVIVLDCMGYNEKMKTYLENTVPGILFIQSNELIFDYMYKKSK